ncbi:TlpA disulfide reductase family protein [Silanimonas sp.]|jgi:thiol-disulfide isomerase/thioredoxin|uniref:TlpA family protein disulfide reductase n=1 Tax=Silanimonas sp. TaxID=1929290 RepID=UPI0022CC6ED7|nr:TlpA disulfide reductase family protein [Silanimonas sp.]MCZ8116278.1 TlpA disulfide reductase family protein [Silanimonas sp.]
MPSCSAFARPALVAALAVALAACGPSESVSPDAGPVEAATPIGEAAPAEAAPATAEAAPAAAPAVPADAAKPTHPTLAVDTVDHGRFDLASHRGQWVVVNFWATWCAPCLKEIPDLNALDAKREDLVVIGLAYEEITPEAMRAFYVEKVKPEYPVAIVDVYNPPADFDTPRGLPFTVLVAPDGTVGHKFLGPVTGAEIEAKISEVSAASTSAGEAASTPA